MKLNLGCGRDIRSGWCNVDMVSLPGVDLVADLSHPNSLYDIADDVVTHMDMPHLLEHIADPLPLLEELWRVAQPGCTLMIALPHGANDMAFADPQHIRQYFPSSFQFFAQPSYKRADYGYKGDWDTLKLWLSYDPAITGIPESKIMQLGMQARNVFWEMRAELRAVKPRRLVSEHFEYNPDVVLEPAK
jgi:hypothetical protein